MLALVFGSLLEASLPLVVIDPGHGGEQAGAAGVCKSPEKDVVLAIADELRTILEVAGAARVQLTRHKDVDLELVDRPTLANELGARLFVSIHANASSDARHAGFEVFTLARGRGDRRVDTLLARENERQDGDEIPASAGLPRILASLQAKAVERESERLARHLYRELSRSHRYRARGIMRAPFLVLRGATMAATLVEVGFLTHPEECQALARRSYQREIATRLASGIMAHLALEDATMSPSTLTAHGTDGN